MCHQASTVHVMHMQRATGTEAGVDSRDASIPEQFCGLKLANIVHALPQDAAHAAAHALAQRDAGSDIIDLGAESTRPGHRPVGIETELDRLLPVIERVRAVDTETIVSVDTYHASTARAAAQTGAEIVNDVSGLLWDAEMAAAVAQVRTGLVLMHTRGRPTEWGSQPALAATDVLPLVAEGLRERLTAALAAGIPRENIVLDPGFGFGKRGTENFALLAGFSRFAALGQPLLAGVSRKRFLGDAAAKVGASARVNTTTAANVAVILGGAHIIRVHDLQEAREAVAIADAVIAQT